MGKKEDAGLHESQLMEMLSVNTEKCIQETNQGHSVRLSIELSPLIYLFLLKLHVVYPQIQRAFQIQIKYNKSTYSTYPFSKTNHMAICM